jgi:hypothetical protein
MAEIVATEEQYHVALNDDGTYELFHEGTPTNFADALGNNRARSLAVRYGGQTPAREQEIATMSDLPSLDPQPRSRREGHAALPRNCCGTRSLRQLVGSVWEFSD